MKQVIQGTVVRQGRVQQEQILFDTKTGLIEDVGQLGLGSEHVSEVYSDDCLIFAGMGDIHIHAREDLSQNQCYKEDFSTASQAALNGGVTHLCDMPNNPVPPIDDASYLKKLLLARKALVPLCPYAGIGPQTRPLNKTVPYKVYMGPSIGDLFFQNAQELEQVLTHYRGQNVSFHCEDPEVLQEHKHLSTHEARRPKIAEVMATKTCLQFIEKFELAGKLCHYSAAEGLPLIHQARMRGLKVECEVTPQHLYFCQEDFSHWDQDKRVLMQMNPPLRGMEDRQALLEALLRGDIDYLATDHAPHSLEEKMRGTSGLTGLDTYGAFTTWLMAEKGVDPLIISKICCENPGRFFNRFLPSLKEMDSGFQKWGKGFGLIERGYSASFTVLNLKKPWRVTKERLRTKNRLSPFEGVTFPGQVECVYLQGKKMIDY